MGANPTEGFLAGSRGIEARLVEKEEEEEEARGDEISKLF